MNESSRRARGPVVAGVCVAVGPVWARRGAALLEIHAIRRTLTSVKPSRARRTRAATAALLSSLFPGIGQLYNREWLKAAAMIAATLTLVLALHTAVGVLVREAAAVAAVEAPVVGLADPADWLALVPAMGHPAVVARARRTLLPPAFGLCAVVLWSMIDAYRHPRG